MAKRAGNRTRRASDGLARSGHLRESRDHLFDDSVSPLLDLGGRLILDRMWNEYGVQVGATQAARLYSSSRAKL
jgi:hypothetical protein